MKNILAKHNFCELANLFKIKKFFKNAECKADNSNSKFNLLLDGKKIKSPSKHILESNSKIFIEPKITKIFF